VTSLARNEQVELQRATDFVRACRAVVSVEPASSALGFYQPEPGPLFTTAFSERVPNSSNFALKQYQD
jgi:hypothetical protein